MTANNGREALFAASQEKPDIIILDLMMPEMADPGTVGVDDLPDQELIADGDDFG